jgi:hypothetical protein
MLGVRMWRASVPRAESFEGRTVTVRANACKSLAAGAGIYP